MTNTKKIHRYKAGATGSSTETSEEVVETKREGTVLRGADYLWARLPFSKYEYERWSEVWRIVLGYLAWLIVLPLWPLVVFVVLWINGNVKRKGIVFSLLAVIGVLWFWMFLSILGVH